MFVKPVAGRQVPRPEGGFLPEDGQNVEPTQYWLRRIEDGDVVEANPAAVKPAAVTTKAE